MNPVPLGSLLDRVTKKLGLAPRLRQEMAVHLWPRVAGPEVAAQTVPGPVRDRVLIVRTANPVLAHQLTLMEREILQRYRKLLGGQFLRGIHLQIGQVAPKTAAGGATSPAAPDLSPERERQLNELAKTVPDPVWRSRFSGRRGPGPAIAGPRRRNEPGSTWSWLREITGRRRRRSPKPWRRSIRKHARPFAPGQAKTLRRKILARLVKPPRDPESILRLRGDLRRLALVTGYPAGKAARAAVADLLGPEAAAAWPGEE